MSLDPARSDTRDFDRIALKLALAQLVLGLALGFIHVVGGPVTEVDFYHMYAPGARALASGEPYASLRSGPGYSALLLLFSAGFLELFTAGKILAALGVSAFGYASYRIGVRLSTPRAALLLQGLLYIVLLRFSFVAGNDVTGAALCALSLFVLFRSERPSWKECALAGAIGGCALLTRYTAASYLAAVLLGLAYFERDSALFTRLKLVAAFGIGVVAANLPWWIASYRWYGAYSNNKGYALVAMDIYGKPSEMGQEAPLRAMEKRFSSLGDVLLSDPRRTISHFAFDFYSSAHQLIEDLVTLPGALFMGIGLIALFCYRRERWQLATFLLFGVLGFLNSSLVPYKFRFYFAILPVLFLPVAVALTESWSVAGFDTKRAQRWARAVVIVVLGTISAIKTVDYLTDEPREVLPASEVLAKHARAGDRLAARKPQLGFITNIPTVEMPPGKPVEYLMDWMVREKARFLYVGPTEVAVNGNLSALAAGEDVPSTLKLLHKNESPRACLYARD